MQIIPASSIGDDIELYNLKKESIAQFHFLRQQVKKVDYQFCLSDFIAPRGSGKADWLGAFAVTTGIGLDKIVEGFEANNDDYNAIMAKALADRLAEAFAEKLHDLTRKEYWGYAPNENLTIENVLKENKCISCGVVVCQFDE